MTVPDAIKKNNFATRVKDMGAEVKAMKEELASFKKILDKHPAIAELLNHPFVRDFKYWETKIRKLEQTSVMVLQKQNSIEQQLRRAENLVTRAELSRTRGA